MLIVGKWLVCDDGITRPIVEAKVSVPDGPEHGGRFLVDSAADRTVFTAELLERLGAAGNHAAPGFGLAGIGGRSPFVLVQAVIEMTRDDGGPARFRGEFAAFTDPKATDLSILGRDVLDLLDVILSRRRGEVLLLAPNHRYQVLHA